MTSVSYPQAGPDTVWALISDVERWGERLPTFDSVERVSGSGAVGVGDRFRVRQPRLRDAEYEITSWEPGRAFTWESSAPGVHTTATHVIDTIDGNTRLQLGVDWTGPLAWLVKLLLGRRTDRMVRIEGETFGQLAAQGRDAANG